MGVITAVSVRLLSRTDKDLVDAYPLRLADRVGYGVGYVFGLERLYVPLLQPLADFLVGDVVGQLRRHRARLDHRYADAVLQQLLAQGFGDGVDGELRPGVDAYRRYL